MSDGVVMAGMVSNALLCDRGRFHNVLPDVGVELRKLSPGAGFFDSDVQPVIRDCFQHYMKTTI
jgi:hypothetical protein